MSDSITQVRITGGLALASSPMEAKTVRKVQTRIIPFIFLLYIVGFLDRINIGFAALTMNKELAITSQQYGLVFLATLLQSFDSMMPFYINLSSGWLSI